ncbi:MAG: hypothetical protein ABN489_12245, partial [Pseudomonas amygdali]
MPTQSIGTIVIPRRFIAPTKTPTQGSAFFRSSVQLLLLYAFEADVQIQRLRRRAWALDAEV